MLFSDCYLEKSSVIPGTSKVKFQESNRAGPTFTVLKKTYSLCTLLNGFCPENKFVLISHFALCVSVVWKSYI